jgi:cytochrome c oxidase cbb3-type subunit 3
MLTFACFVLWATECRSAEQPKAAGTLSKAQPAAAHETTPDPSKPQATDARQHGAELYGRMCAVCHGPSGEGYKADQAPAIGQADFLASVTDNFLRHAIVSGRMGTTMSAWAKELGGPLSGVDVEALIAFIRSWSKRPPVTLDERPATGDAARGEQIFGRQCQSCHGARGMLGPNVRIGSRGLLTSASNGFLRLAMRKGRAKTTMLGFEATLGDQGIEDLVVYLRSVQNALPPAVPPLRRPPPLPLGPVPQNPHGPEPQGFHTYPGVTSVDVVHAQLVRHARMALLDARAPSDYANEHIAGAVSVPFYDPAPYFAALPKHAWLVCYCACPHAESSELAQKLVSAGFKKVTVLQEGLGAWIVKKYGTHKGEKP